MLLCTTFLLYACAYKSPDTRDDSATKSGRDVIGSRAENQLKFDQGIDALAVKDYARAERIFRQLARDNPKLSGPFANLALIQFKQGDLSQARTLVGKAIALNPLQFQAYHLRAQIKLQQGEIHESREDYEKAIALYPDYLNAHYNLALLYDIYLQEIALAIEHYTIYLALLGKDDERTREWINHLKKTLNNG